MSPLDNFWKSHYEIIYLQLFLTAQIWAKKDSSQQPGQQWPPPAPPPGVDRTSLPVHLRPSTLSRPGSAPSQHHGEDPPDTGHAAQPSDLPPRLQGQQDEGHAGDHHRHGSHGFAGHGVTQTGPHIGQVHPGQSEGHVGHGQGQLQAASRRRPMDGQEEADDAQMEAELTQQNEVDIAEKLSSARPTSPTVSEMEYVGGEKRTEMMVTTPDYHGPLSHPLAISGSKRPRVDSGGFASGSAPENLTPRRPVVFHGKYLSDNEYYGVIGNLLWKT